MFKYFKYSKNIIPCSSHTKDPELYHISQSVITAKINRPIFYTYSSDIHENQCQRKISVASLKGTGAGVRSEHVE
jgi:hypothetical protein